MKEGDGKREEARMKRETEMTEERDREKIVESIGGDDGSLKHYVFIP